MKFLKSLIYDPLAGNFLAVIVGVFFVSLSSYANGSYGIVPGLWTVILGVTLATYWITWLHAIRQAELIEGGTWPNHTRLFWQRVGLAYIAGQGIHYVSEQAFTWHSWVLGLALALYIGAEFWLLFDFMVNKRRRREWIYRGTGKNDANTDKFFARRTALWLATKFLGLPVALAIYLYIFYHG